jgi:uncharacterized protein
MSVTRAVVFGLLLASSVAAASARVVPLIDATKARDAQLVQTLLAQRVDPNESAVDGTRALHWAAHIDDNRIAELLVNAGADVQAANRYGVVPLWLACVNGSAAMVERLLAAGADPNTTMPEGDTALMTAARSGGRAVVKALVDRGANVNARESWKGQTALMWAAANDNVPAVQALVEAGADVQARTKFRPMRMGNNLGRPAERNGDATKQAGFTALHFAVRAGASDAVRVLLKSGAKLTDTTSDGTGVLVLAIASTHFDLAKWLLAQGADPNAVAQGWTPLHQIAYTRRPSTGVSNPGLVPRDKTDSLTLVTELLDRGANPNRAATKNPDITNVGRKRLTEVGTGPLWVASQGVDLPYMRLLLERGADPHQPNTMGDTPLLAASGLVIEKQGESPGTPEEVARAVKLLLDWGADPTVVDVEGNTALHGAAVWGSNGAVELLVQAGAKLDVKNKRGLTPWRIAEGAQFEDSVSRQPHTAELLRRLLEERGLKVE